MAATILKNRKLTYHRRGLSAFDKIWHSGSSSFLTVPIVKNLNFYKSKMVAAAILKNPKLRYLDNGLTDRHKIWHVDAIGHL